MTKIQKPSELCNTFLFTEFDYVKEHQVSFRNTELGKIKELFPFDSLSKQLCLAPARTLLISEGSILFIVVTVL